MIRRGARAVRWLVAACLFAILVARLPLMPASAQSEAAPGAASDAPAGPELVEIGAYLNDVQAIDLRNHNYMESRYRPLQQPRIRQSLRILGHHHHQGL